MQLMMCLSKLLSHFSVISGVVFSFDIIYGIFYAFNIDITFYVPVLATFYIIFPLAIFIFLIVNVIQFNKITRLTDKEKKDREQKKLLMRLIKFCWILGIFHVLFLIDIALSFVNPINDVPIGLVLTYFIEFFITAIINLAQIWFVPEVKRQPYKTSSSSYAKNS